MPKITGKTNLTYSVIDANHTTRVVLGVDVPVYEKPILKNYGDVRDVTLGPTGPPTESGSGAANPRCNPSTPQCS